MRSAGNLEPSARLKQRILEPIKDRIAWVADDNDNVVEICKAIGIKVIQPDPDYDPGNASTFRY